MKLDSIRAELRALGAIALARRAHAARLGAARSPTTRAGAARQDFLPKPVREALPALDARAGRHGPRDQQHPAEDGSARLLVGLHDGQTVETVLLPRDGVCVSSQVGCAVGCQFCMTGQRRPGAASHQWRNRRPGGARAAAAAGQESGVHGHGRAGPQPRQRARGHRACWGWRPTSATRTWCFPPSATCAPSNAWPPARSSRRWRCPCTPPSRPCAPACCRARRT